MRYTRRGSRSDRLAHGLLFATNIPDEEGGRSRVRDSMLDDEKRRRAYDDDLPQCLWPLLAWTRASQRIVNSFD